MGDVLLDRDVDGQVTRFSPDGPVPVVDTLGVRRSPGGAGLTALLAADAARVVLVAPFGDDEDASELRRLLGGRADIVPLRQAGPTRRKTRVRSAGQTIVRVDDGGPAAPVDVPAARVREALEDADVVLVSDYGGGTTHDGAVRDALAATARTRTVVWDPHPRGGPPVPGAAVVTPNLAEALAAADALGLGASGDDPGALAQALAHAWQVETVCVTVGAQGAYLARPTGEVVYVPAELAAGDPCGAGDRFASHLACELTRGGHVHDALPSAVRSATAWVAAGGADAYRRRGTTPQPAPGDPDAPARPGASSPEAARARLRSAGGTVVATGGCFDLLHAGHVATLEAAARLGDHLVVLLNSDDSVRRLKGPGRPVVGQEDRARVLAALDCVSDVVVFDQDDPRDALDALRPDVWAKGGDYRADDLPEAEVVRRHGGRVVVVPFVEGRSTTDLLRRAAPVGPTTSSDQKEDSR
ncbi:PfkB family carbohydrate kinase [Isoptericola sp. 4D.3]|uniref:PfkB family carbohydrate kinase n=1 Tax=Isoptericola peretonis TaxID=2918523 RepID=A0ABT0J790_9MICO|nr:PfkB family carbohydrate kinase [Isoptericola sp. 4D.3]